MYINHRTAFSRFRMWKTLTFVPWNLITKFSPFGHIVAIYHVKDAKVLIITGIPYNYLNKFLFGWWSLGSFCHGGHALSSLSHKTKFFQFQSVRLAVLWRSLPRKTRPHFPTEETAILKYYVNFFDDFSSPPWGSQPVCRSLSRSLNIRAKRVFRGGSNKLFW